MKKILAIIILFSLTACNAQDKKKKDKANAKTENSHQFKVIKTDAEWREDLSADEYEILRNKGTERPYTGKYDKFFEDGVYVCAACGNPLFESDTKFDSHCGWPSFDQAIKGSVIYKEDRSHGMVRTEVMCANCGGHLGHVFDDGPEETTGKRFCTNSISIKFIPAEELKKTKQ